MINRPDSPVDWAVALLDRAETVDDVRHILKSSARAAVGAQGATVVERDGDQCHYADEDAISPLWKGERFPISTCISGWAMVNGQTAVIPDIRLDPRIPQKAYRPTFVRALVMVPINGGGPVGAVGAYWDHPRRASPEEIALLERLAVAAGRALARVHRPARQERSVEVVAGTAG
jgi:GAF domain-containing protein